MARCEDWPCCGHAANDCPDPDVIDAGFLPYPCLKCHDLIRPEDAMRGHESFHRKCYGAIDWETFGERDGEDYFDDYHDDDRMVW